MDAETRTRFEQLWGSDKDAQNVAYFALIDQTAPTLPPVAWAYEVWDELVANLRHNDNHRRSIAAQLLCQLARSDPEQRILRDLPALLTVSRDERFVTARHTLQSLWKIGLAGEVQRQQVLAAMAARYADCANEKNSTLIRFDLLQGMRYLYDVVGEAAIKTLALAWIEQEVDPKYRKKYAGVWRTA